MNEETRYVINILVSMIPIGIVGVFFKDEVEAIFGSGLVVVGCCLLLTALLLSFSYYYKPKQKENISMKDAFIIGLAQACAVLRGFPVRAVPLQPVCCWATTRRSWHSSLS